MAVAHVTDNQVNDYEPVLIKPTVVDLGMPQGRVLDQFWIPWMIVNSYGYCYGCRLFPCSMACLSAVCHAVTCSESLPWLLSSKRWKVKEAICLHVDMQRYCFCFLFYFYLNNVWGLLLCIKARDRRKYFGWCYDEKLNS